LWARVPVPQSIGKIVRNPCRNLGEVQSD
jgi:hypothetical protein